MSERGTIEILIVMIQRGIINFKRYKDCETGWINIHSDPKKTSLKEGVGPETTKQPTKSWSLQRDVEK